MEVPFTSLSLRRVIIFLIFIIVLQVSPGFSWWLLRHRTTRRTSPTTAKQCSNQAWSQWSQCTPLCGTIANRSRSRKTCSSKDETVTQGCDPNGGCEQICVKNKCSCVDGYSLDTRNGKACIDIDECKPNGGRGPCSHACKNYRGSYRCSCEPGHRLQGGTKCVLRDCNEPKFTSCPTQQLNIQNGDGGLAICAKINYDCRNGTKYNSQCSLSCPQSYSLALKDPTQSWVTFAAFDFNTPSYQIICHLKSGTNQVFWHIQLDRYYCRRNNDPPISLHLDNAVITEGSLPGTIVGKLSAVDGQKQQTIVYSVQSSNQTLFRCRGSNLESLVVFKWKPNIVNSYLVLIRAQDNGSPGMWIERRFKISVKNVNDPPRNIEISTNSVAENATIATVVGTLTAIDDDVSLMRSSQFSWKLITNSSENFNISGADVIVSKSLNYDLAKEHYIRVACYDSMGAFLERSLLIYVINSIDPPTLTLNGNKIPENSDLGTVIGQVEAKSESNLDLVFSLSASNAHVLTKFALSPTTECLHHQSATKFNTTCVVNLTISGHLDFEEESEYMVQVFVKNDESSNFRKWNITVEDVNEKPDKLEFNGITEIPEATRSGEEFCFILVSDPDNRNAITQQHRCSIDNKEGDGKYFQVNHTTNTLQVKRNKTLNYETQQTYNVTLTCTDNGNPPLSIMGSVIINVTDTDEPIENLTLSNNDIAENSPNDTLVGYLSAYDPDIHRPNSFIFSIVGPEDVPFRIKDDNQLVVNGSLNFEENSEFVVTIRVVDTSGSSLQWPFKISILDVNESPTNILLSTKSMNERLVPGSLISNITMIDEDENTITNCQLRNDGNGKIAVDDTLLVAGETTADYELDTSHFVEISLTCCDQYKLCLTRNFSIQIKDVNEPPTDIMVDNLDVIENKKDIIIGDISVIDHDKNQNHFCTLSNNTGYLKIINERTLFLVKELNYEKESVKKFQISCKEIGNFSSYFITKQFELNVIDVNEEPTKGCSVPFFVSSDQSIGSVISSLNVTDPDNERVINKDSCQPKQQLRYIMEPNNEDFPFKIFDGYLVKTGVVEENTTYNMTVSVEDDGVLETEKITNKTLKVQFKCTVFAIALQRSFITLSSNRINQLSVNGTMIGYFNTTRSADVNISNFAMEYQLVPETCNTYPFGIVRNKLILTFSEERRVGQDDDSGIPDYVIIQVNSSNNKSSDVISTRFLITIKDDKKAESSMCFQNNTILKNNALKTKLGPIIIKQNRKEECENEGTTKDRYMCEVKPSYNKSSEDFKKINLTNRVYVDQDMFLRINTSLDYENFALDKLVVLVTCWSHSMPLFVVRGKLGVTIQDCERTSENRKVCMTCENKPCMKEESCTDLRPAGYNCTWKDTCEKERSYTRNDGLCSMVSECPKHSFCSKMVGSTTRCVEANDQVMIGVSFRLNESSFCHFEKCLEGVLENTEDTGDICLKDSNGKLTENRRRKRKAGENLHVEILHVTRSVHAKKTLLYIAVWEQVDGRYNLKEKSSVLTLFTNTNVVVLRTKQDCAMFENSGIICPLVGEHQTHGKNIGSPLERPKLQAAVGAGAAIVLIVIVVAVFYCFKKRQNRRKQVKKSQSTIQINDNLGFYEMDMKDMTEPEKETKKKKKPEHNFNNPVYQEPKQLQPNYNERKSTSELIASKNDSGERSKKHEHNFNNPVYQEPKELQPNYNERKSTPELIASKNDSGERSKNKKAQPDANNPVYQEPEELQLNYTERKGETAKYYEPITPKSSSLEAPKNITNPVYGGIIPVQNQDETSGKTESSSPPKNQPWSQKSVRESITGELLNAREKCQKLDPKNQYPFYEELPPVKESKKTNKKVTNETLQDSSPYYHVLDVNNEEKDPNTNDRPPVYFVLETENQYKSLHRDLDGPPPEYAEYKLPGNTGEPDQAPKDRVYEELPC